jgi:hypothetical protein
LTLDGSGNVQDWAERWANGIVFSQATPSKRPTVLSNVLGSVSGIRSIPANASQLDGNQAARAVLKNRTGMTVYAIFRYRSNGNQYMWWNEIPSTSAGRFVVGQTSTNAALLVGARVNDTGSAQNLGGPHIQLPYVQNANAIVDWANAKAYLYRNNVLCAQANPFLTPGGTTNADSRVSVLFSLNGLASTFVDGELVRMIVCNGVHSDAQRALYWQQLKLDYPADVWLPVAAANPDLIVQLHGDSITQGNALSIGTKTLADHLWESLGSNPLKATVNLGWTGATVNTLLTDRPNTVDILTVTAANRILYVIFAGTNDISSGDTGANCYNETKLLFQGAKTARPGIKVVVCTPIARGGSFTNAQKIELNNLRTQILTNAIMDGADAIADLGGLAQFLTGASSTVYTNSANYLADQIHPTNTGTIALADTISAAINSIP